MDFTSLDLRPIVIALAGPNGAGKSTFFYSHLAKAGLRFVNADVLARELALEPYQAARLAEALRRELLRDETSFVFETVFSDPVGDKVTFLAEAAQRGWIVVLCYIGIADSQQSLERVAMRVSQGGHDVPDEKLEARFPRTLQNLHAAVRRLPHVLIYDNSDLARPFREVAIFDHGQLCQLNDPAPSWLEDLLAGWTGDRR